MPQTMTRKRSASARCNGMTSSGPPAKRRKPHEDICSPVDDVNNEIDDEESAQLERVSVDLTGLEASYIEQILEEATDDDLTNSIVRDVEVPQWFVVNITKSSSHRNTEDISDAVYVKRHRKLEREEHRAVLLWLKTTEKMKAAAKKVSAAGGATTSS